MSDKITEMIRKHYDLQLKFNTFLNKQHSSRDFERIIQDPGFKQVKDEFCTAFGIFGGGFAVINHPFNSLIFLQNPVFNSAKNKIPFPEFRFRFQDQDQFQGHPKSALKKLLIDLILEGNREELKLDVARGLDSPRFFHNLPPHESIYAPPLTRFEKSLRKNKSINFLYCGKGEILFFTYAWRWLIRMAQLHGWKSRIDLSKPRNNEINPDKQLPSIWETSFWYPVSNCPEKDWLSTLASLSKWSTKLESIPFQDLQAYWNTTIDQLDIISAPSQFSFLQDWPILGLSRENPHYQDSLKAIITYCKHLLQEYTRSEKIDRTQNFHFKYTFSKQPVAEINNLVEEILLEKNKNYKEIKIQKLFALGKEEEIFYHFIFRKVIYEVLVLANNKKDNAIVDLFKMLQKMARFPVLPYYFQLALSEEKIPLEHYVFPISNNYEFPAKTKIPNLINQDIPINAVVLGLFSLKSDCIKMPCEGIEQVQNSQDAITLARLLKMQDLIKQVAQPIIDKGFYNSVVRPGIEQKTTLEYQDKISHEIKKISNSIFIKSNIKLDKLLQVEVDETIPKSPYVGKLVIASQQLKEEVDQWLIIPNPKRFIYNQTLLNTWIGVKDITSNYKFEKAMRLSAILIQFIDISSRVRAIRKIEGLGKPKHMKDIKAYEAKYLEELKAIKEGIKVTVQVNQDLIWQPKVLYLDDDTVELKKTAFIQLLLASFVNTYEHVGNYIAIKAYIDNDHIRIKMKNDARKGSHIVKDKKVGTKAVLMNCLRQLQGTLEAFTFEQQEFITSFSFPFKKIFILDLK